jgi:hypothetical protein
MPRFHIVDRTGGETYVTAPDMDAALAAAREWAEDGSWDERFLLEVIVRKVDDDGKEITRRYLDVMVGPETPEPPCPAGEHHWIAPVQLVGGCDSNPGVHAHGGTAYSQREVCRHCGTYRVIYRPGRQRGPDELEEEIYYERPDEATLRWLGLEE